MNTDANPVLRPSRLPVLIVTGASGFIGRHVLDAFKYEFYIYAIARRAQRAVGIDHHENINWIRLDVGNEDMVREAFSNIRKNGGADYMIHLAGYYDFTNKNHPEYKRTNINGTRLVLKYAKGLNLKRFIFASSLTVSDFGKKGPVLNEKSKADANFPYALSKKEGEKIVKKFSKNIPCTVVRCAAIFSDWCEYGPLYVLLSMWLSERWDSNILSGRGEAAIPYFHTRNLNALFFTIIQRSSTLKNYDVFIASHDGCTSQKELHNISMRYNYGESTRIRFFPTWFSMLGVTALYLFGLLKGKKPFIRPWMLKLTDKKMIIDASNTRKILNWRPVERFQIKRRLLFLIENRKSNPYEWERLNEQAISKGGETRINLLIYESMVHLEQKIITEILALIKNPENANKFASYIMLDVQELEYRFRNLYKMLKTAVLLGDRLHVLSYARTLAVERFKEHFEVREVINAISLVGDLIVSHLKLTDKLTTSQLRIHDEILLTVQLIIDELEDSYDRLLGVY
jgi:nucleoside-diphosphate-sugar epimerase